MALVSEAPTGTVTFLFSDVVGSTRLWAENPDAMSASLRIHDQIFEETIAKYDGFIFATAGDSFAASFARASSAVECAAAIQEQLGQIDWGSFPELKVRMGLHVGEAEERNGNYFGPAVNHAARLMAVAHGDQCIMTDGVRDAAGVDGIDLGTHTLRDIDHPVHINQLGEGEFPPLWTIGVGVVALPSPRTSLIGRDEAVIEVRRLLGANRLVTLTGVGGCGKTRLSIEVAYREVSTHPDGVWFVDLSTITDENALLGAFATALQLSITAEVPALEQVVAYLAQREGLLVIDNCEHMVDAVAELVDRLLESCPAMTILATSRESLEVDGEHTWKIPSLPGGEGAPAVELFYERASAAGAVLPYEPATIEAVSEIVARLDGIPLAIELAAARTRSMGSEEIRDLLDDRFSLLSGGSRRSRQRQATLEGAVQWSYDLLSDDERSMLQAAAVFQGGFSIGDIAAVADVSTTTALNLVDALASKSLVDVTRGSSGHVRHRLLETIRLFSLARLVDAGEAVATRDRHLDHFNDHGATLSLARVCAIDEVLRSGREYENFRSAIAWALERDRSEAAVRIAAARYEAAIARGEAQLALTMFERPADLAPGDRAGVATERVWLLIGNGQIMEALAEIAQARALCAAAPGDYDVHMLLGDGYIRAILGDLTSFGDLTEQARQRATDLGDPLLVAGCDLFWTSHLAQIGRLDEAIDVARSALANAPHFAYRHIIEAALCWSLLEAKMVEEAAEVVAHFTPIPPGSSWAYCNDILGSLVSAHTESPEAAGRSLALQARVVLERRPEIGGEFLTSFGYLHLLSDRPERARELVRSAIPVALAPEKVFILVGGQVLSVPERLALIEEEASQNPLAEVHARYANHGAGMIADEIEYWSPGEA